MGSTIVLELDDALVRAAVRRVAWFGLVGVSVRRPSSRPGCSRHALAGREARTSRPPPTLLHHQQDTMLPTAVNVGLALLAMLLSALIAISKLRAKAASSAPAARPSRIWTGVNGSISPKGPRFVARFSRGSSKPRATSTPPERPPPKRSRALRALSPGPQRVKQRFGQHVANALGEGSQGRPPRISSSAEGLVSYSSDGLRLTREAAHQRLQNERMTLPKFGTPSDATGVAHSLLPSDAAPWDRLHVWLVEGEGLPRRPWLWPFEPYVLVTAVAEGASSEPGEMALSTESFEFQSRPEFSSSTTPVWDEQGMICFRRGGHVTKCHVIVMSTAKLWSGLYHVRALRPRALLNTLLAWLRASCAATSSFVLRLARWLTAARSVAATEARPNQFEPISASPLPSRSLSAGGSSPASSSPALRPATGSPPSADHETTVTFELPPAGGGWTDLCVPLHPDCGGTIRLRVRVSAWEDRPVDLRNVGETAAVPADFAPAPAAATLGFAHDVTASAYAARMSPPPADDGMEHTVLDTGCAALSYYNLPPKGDAALLWLPGRNDCFYHPHVAELLADHGIDLYVLSYRRMGVCRKLGLFSNPMHNSHCASGDFAEYHADVDAALRHIRSRHSYSRLLGYGHSTGAPVLLDYLMAHGDDAFDGFIYNSPFLDWGHVGGVLTKGILMYSPAILTALRMWDNETELLGGGGPSAWALQLYSQYPFDPSSRPLFTVPLTIGYCRGINAVQRKLRRRSRAGVAITRKPFLVLTSMHDDVLHGDEMALAAHAIGPSRTLVQMCHARHDVLVSADRQVVTAALQYMRTWLTSRGFPEVARES